MIFLWVGLGFFFLLMTWSMCRVGSDADDRMEADIRKMMHQQLDEPPDKEDANAG